MDIKPLPLVSNESRESLPITCCIMSWKSPRTLEATLQTYLRENLFDFFDEVIVLFQEISDEDRLLAETARNEFVLLLENDCILVEPRGVVEVELTRALSRVQNDEVDVYRLRHRWQPGEKFDTVRKFKKYHQPTSVWSKIKAFLRPFKRRRLIGTAPYVLEDISWPRYMRYVRRQVEGDYIADSAVLPWTNQSVMCRRDWLLGTILPYVENHPSSRPLNGFQDVERALNCRWWRRQNIRIGLGLGVFSHERLDF